MPSPEVDLRRPPRWHPVEIGAVVAAIGYLLWPVARRGDLLGRDLIFAPYAKLDLATLGLSGASPRAVPLDAVVGLTTAVFGSQITGRLALLATVVAIAVGVRRMVPSVVLPARLAAITIALVNPFVVERLAMGQWALLAAYGAVPWVLVGTRDFMHHGRFAIGLLGVWIASLTPTGGVLAVAAVAAVVARSSARPRRRVGALAVALFAQAPWIVAGLVSGATLTSDSAGNAVFAAHGQARRPAALTLLTGGGIWNVEVVPPSQRGPLAWVWFAVVVAIAVWGAREFRQHLARLAGPTLGLAAVGFALAVLPTFQLGGDFLAWLSTYVPGAGLLRDSHKWVAPYVVCVALLAAFATDRLCRSLHHAAAGFAAIAAIAVPYALLPDAASVLATTLRPTTYSAEWDAVRAKIDSGDTTLVIPAGGYRNFEWNDRRPSVDPAPRLLPGVVLIDDRLVVSGVSVAGESSRAQAAIAALSQPDAPGALADVGVDFVLIEHQTPGDRPPVAGDVLHDGAQLTLVRIAGARAQLPGGGAVAAVVGAHVGFLLLPALAVGAAARSIRRRVEKN